MKIIFILGSGHCGSTLLDLILDDHSKIVGVGELSTFKKTSIKNEFWDSIIGDESIPELNIYRDKKSFLLNNNEFKTSDTSKVIDINKYIKFHERLYGKVLSKTGATVIVDSSKNPDRVELLSQSNIIEPVVLHVVRDGRGVFWSYFRKYKNNVLFCIFKWILSNVKVEILRMRVKHIPYYYISYSMFTNNPFGTLKKIIKVLDLEFEDTILNYRDFNHNQIGGNRMKNGNTSVIKEETSWKEDIPLYYKVVLSILYFPLLIIYKIRRF